MKYQNPSEQPFITYAPFAFEIRLRVAVFIRLPFFFEIY
jgi:hypothetical protein